MLVLARKPEEKVIITVAGLKIEVTVVASDNGRAKLGFTAPKEVQIFRSELEHKILSEGRPLLRRQPC